MLKLAVDVLVHLIAGGNCCQEAEIKQYSRMSVLTEAHHLTILTRLGSTVLHTSYFLWSLLFYIVPTSQLHTRTPLLNLHSRRIQPYIRERQGQESLLPALGIYVVSLFNLIALKTSGGLYGFCEWWVPVKHPSHVCIRATHTYTNHMYVM